MKFHISHNDHKNISHNIMQGHPFPTMSAMKKMDPHKIQRLVTNECDTPKIKGWERPNLMRNLVEKKLKLGGKRDD
jgi:hypothetical protein